MTIRDSIRLSGPPRFSGHKLGRFATSGEGYLVHATGDQIDLHAYLTRHSTSIQLMPIHTNIMRASGLCHGGIAVVDKARKPVLGDLLAVRFNGDLIMRRLEKREGLFCFVADDPREPRYYVYPETTVERLGVIIHAINSFCDTPFWSRNDG